MRTTFEIEASVDPRKEVYVNIKFPDSWSPYLSELVKEANALVRRMRAIDERTSSSEKLARMMLLALENDYKQIGIATTREIFNQLLKDGLDKVDGLEYNRPKATITASNGALFRVFLEEDPTRLCGAQFDCSISQEVSEEMKDGMIICTRMGENPVNFVI